MKTAQLDTPAKRISIAVAVLTGLVLLAAAIYAFLGVSSTPPINGLKIIAAAHAYTQALRLSHVPVPHTVSLQSLVNQKLLLPADLGPFQGMDGSISLTADPKEGAQAVLMRVHMPDGADLVLLADGSAQEVNR